MEDASVTHPERHVVGAVRRAVQDQITRSEVGFLQALASLLLLVGISRHEAPASSEGHVDEARAVDPGRGHPSPLVTSAEERAGMLDRLRGDRQKPVGVAFAAEVFRPRPSQVCVGGLDANPLAVRVEYAQRLAG